MDDFSRLLKGEPWLVDYGHLKACAKLSGLTAHAVDPKYKYKWGDNDVKYNMDIFDCNESRSRVQGTNYFSSKYNITKLF